ncbi:response regulator [Xanthobacter sp. ZOL 2024]
MKPLLLLVEDDALEACRLESVVTQLGYDCIHACDGDAALAQLARTRFDVVLLDLVLPELDGMGVLGAMKARGLTAPVVVAVRAEGIDAAQSALRAGARDFVVKPAGALRLQVALANAAALGRAEAALAARDNIIPLAPRLAAAPATGAAWDAAAADPADADPRWIDASGHVRPLEALEEAAIRLACSRYGGRLTEVARRLGIGRSTLYRKLARLGDLAIDDDLSLAPAERAAPQFVAAE